MPGSVNAARSIVDITSKKRITIKIGTKRPILIVRNGRLKELYRWEKSFLVIIALPKCWILQNSKGSGNKSSQPKVQDVKMEWVY